MTSTTLPRLSSPSCLKPGFFSNPIAAFFVADSTKSWPVLCSYQSRWPMVIVGQPRFDFFAAGNMSATLCHQNSAPAASLSPSALSAGLCCFMSRSKSSRLKQPVC